MEIINQCILEDFMKDSSKGTSYMNPDRIILHGLNGEHGRVGQAGVPKEYRFVTMKNSPAVQNKLNNDGTINESIALYNSLSKYVESFKGGNNGERIKSLYLWSSSPGTGKTTLASALINAWIAVKYLTDINNGEQPKDPKALFLDINELQSDYNLAVMTNDDDEMVRIGTLMKKAQSAEFAVIDDVGTRSSTEAFTSYVHTIVNKRTSDGLPTVYTSNLPMSEMKSMFSERIYDRMRDECGEIHFGGKSNRGRR